MKKVKEVVAKLPEEYHVRFSYDADLDHWVAHMSGNGANGIGANMVLALTNLLQNLNNYGMKVFLAERQMFNANAK